MDWFFLQKTIFHDNIIYNNYIIRFDAKGWALCIFRHAEKIAELFHSNC